MKNNVLIQSQLNLPGQKNMYRGKVRDIYEIDDIYLIMVSTDRISAFDTILSKGIPHKGQVLNQIAIEFLYDSQDIVPNWYISSPDPCATVGLQCTPYPVEMIVRGYLSGHAWREYKKGKRKICGNKLPDGLKENDKLPEPIVTPTTKASSGHDEDVTEEYIISQEIMNRKTFKKLKEYSLALFERGTKHAYEHGLILADTKYEFGTYNDKIHLMDEIHTPDSSRYFYAKDFQERQNNNEEQKQLSKEFVRKWLMEQGYQGNDDETMPELPDEFINEVSNRYIELYELLTGKSFEIEDEDEDIHERLNKNLNNFLEIWRGRSKE